jgi:hypothetical protein
MGKAATAQAGHVIALLRHFRGLRDGTHDGVAALEDKQASFARAVPLVAPVAQQALEEINEQLLANSGSVSESGLQRGGGGSSASWTLSWAGQQQADGGSNPGRADLVRANGRALYRGSTLTDRRHVTCS